MAPKGAYNHGRQKFRRYVLFASVIICTIIIVRVSQNQLFGAIQLTGDNNEQLVGYDSVDSDNDQSPGRNPDYNDVLFSDNDKRPRVCVFFGTRPEIIKVAPLIIQLKNDTDFKLITIFTGQHSDIIHDFLDLFNVKVDIWFINILEKKQSINKLFGKMLLRADTLKSGKSDIWIVQGDTTSALAIATVAFHNKIKIGHVEAGLRTYNMYSPFPEEYNRKTISSIATYNFAPTGNNVQNLIREGIDKDRIFLTGNTVIDATKYINKHNLIKKPEFFKTITTSKFALITAHRRENFYRLQSIYESISRTKCESCAFIVPVHPNPSAGEPAKVMCKKDRRFVCVSPIPYQELHWVMKYARVILTDSGGIQEEVTWYNTPTIILRKSTERPESIQAGIAKIVPVDRLASELDVYLSDEYNQASKEKKFPYGRGNSAQLIVDILKTRKFDTEDNFIKLGSSNISMKNENLSKDKIGSA